MMRCFYYQRLLPTGQLKSGVIKLAFLNPESARFYLEQRWKSVIVKLVMLPGWYNALYDGIKLVGQKPMKREELADFFRNMAVMQRSGIPVFDAVEELTGDDSSKTSRRLAEDLLESLRSGSSLTDSMERHSDLIPETVRYLTRIGEASGTLDRTLMDASEHLKRVGKIAQDAKRAMIYPAFVFLSIIGAAIFWISYVIPSISDLFIQMQVELPPLTRWLLELSENVSTHLALSLGLIFAVIYGSLMLVKHNRRVRYRVHQLGLFLPISRLLMRSSALAFITEYLSLLVASGINVVDSLEVLSQATRNEVYRESILRIREGVMRGNSLSSEMRQTKRFPGFAIRLISVGEQTGSLDTQLRYLAEEYRHRFDHVVASISEIIKPAVMILAGGLFILMVIALFLPVYELISQTNSGY